MKAAKNTEVVSKPQMPPALVGDVGEYFDEQVVTDTSDLLIPRILLMHGTSKLVGQGNVHQGDIIDSVTEEVLGNIKKPIEIIPIRQLDKKWSIDKFNGKKYEFLREEPWDESVKNQWEYTENGQQFRRNARLSFYVLLARDAKTNRLPYMISFQRTSYQAGRNIASFFSEALFAFKKGDKNSIPMAQVFELGCRADQAEGNTYFVMEAKRTRLSTPEEIEKAKFWFTQVKSSRYQVDSERKDTVEMDVPDLAGERQF